jgi:hypothetical protein
METYVSGLNDAKLQFKTPSIDAMHIYLRLNGMYCRLWRPPLQTTSERSEVPDYSFY